MGNIDSIETIDSIDTIDTIGTMGIRKKVFKIRPTTITVIYLFTCAI